jgi:phenylalanyl-tRNA synthetase beta chain
VLNLLGIKPGSTETLAVPKFDDHIIYKLNDEIIAGAGQVTKNVLSRFGIKQPVYFALFNWGAVLKIAGEQKLVINELPKYPSVTRDISMVVPKHLAYGEVEKSVNKLKLAGLQEVKLFDIFESEKLGTGKKSIAVNFTFLDEEKTLTDKEIDGWMSKIMMTLEKELNAEIRK